MAEKNPPLIGVVPLVDEGRDSYWMLPGYFEGILEAGGAPVMLPLTDGPEVLARLVSSCDGILVTGGQDVSPELYGEQGADAVTLCCELCAARDKMESALIPLAVRGDVPVLGICRGIQVINAVLGGTLWQDLPKQRPSEVEHHGLPPYEEPVHEVDVLSSTPLAEAIGAGSYAVNSYHHQALRDLAPGLEAMAVAPDGVIEAVWRPESRFLWAVQWHPEFSRGVDEKSRKVFSAFVDAAREASDSGRGLL